MAHLALTVDRDAYRRARFAEQAMERLKTLKSLQLHSFEIGDLCVVWGLGQNAPFSFTQDKSELGLLVGYVIDDGGKWLDSSDVLFSSTGTVPRKVSGDGYYCAITYAIEKGLKVDVDPMGMFPWYWSTPTMDSFVAATSAELIGAHPEVKLEWDAKGLIGVFLTNGLLNDRSIFRGIQRMRAGHQLVVTPEGTVNELQTYQWTRDDSLQSLPFEEACQRVGEELKSAIQKHTPPNGSTSLLLSGGLDSRLMAGYLKEGNATDNAICFGLPVDYEVRAARDVAQSLGMPLYVDTAEIGEEETCQLALNMARWNHLSGGFGSVSSWTHDPVNYRKPKYFWSGYLLDEVAGGLAISTGLDEASNNWNFSTCMKRLCRWGFPRETIQDLLQFPNVSRLTDEIVESWRAEYEHEDWLPSQRSFVAKMKTRPRFHIGSHLHRLSFQSWPLMPALDRRLLHLLFNLNANWIVERRLERSLLQNDFPRLSEIPFDTNSYRFFPHYVKEGAKRFPWMQKAQHWIQKHSHRIYWTYFSKVEPRRYHRLYDLNETQWRRIRAQAEPYRHKLQHLVHASVFDDLLPDPTKRIPFRDLFAEGASKRMLLGWILWHAADDFPSSLEASVSQ